MLHFHRTHPLGSGRRIDQPRTLVIRFHVHPVEFLRRIPKLVRPERFHVQIEWTRLIGVVLQPSRRLAEGACGQIIFGGLPAPAVEQILQHAGPGAGIRRMRIIGQVDGLLRTRLQPVALMPAQPAPAIESAVEILVRLELMIDV